MGACNRIKVLAHNSVEVHPILTKSDEGLPCEDLKKKKKSLKTNERKWYLQQQFTDL